MTAYRKLIETQRQQEQPVDWADAKPIEEQGWPEPEAPLEFLRAETVSCYPELASKPEAK